MGKQAAGWGGQGLADLATVGVVQVMSRCGGEGSNPVPGACPGVGVRALFWGGASSTLVHVLVPPSVVIQFLRGSNLSQRWNPRGT